MVNDACKYIVLFTSIALLDLVASYGVIGIDEWIILLVYVSIIGYTESTHCVCYCVPWSVIVYNISFKVLIDLYANHAWFLVI